MLTPTTSTTANAAIARFRAFHEAARGSVISLKLAKYFAGIEVQTLADLHADTYGETRGTDNEGPTLSQYLEDALGVTYRTAHRYRTHFLSCTQHAPQIADKLTAWWTKWKDSSEAPQAIEAPAKPKGKGKAALATTAPQPQALTLHEVCKLTADDLQSLISHADEWGLNELFEAPLKDVTPPTDPTPKASADQIERLAKFWLSDLSRRALNNEFLKLPKPQREALLTTLEEATDKLKHSLNGKK